MKELQTIQTQQKLNKVYTVGDVGPGGAYHEYYIAFGRNPMEERVSGLEVNFQKGPRNCEGSTSGVVDQDLLEIVRDRLACFQSGDYSCEYNEQALFHVEEALKWLNKRVEDRIARNVLGTYKK